MFIVINKMKYFVGLECMTPMQCNQLKILNCSKTARRSEPERYN